MTAPELDSRPLPHDISAEMAVLGALLSWPDSVAEVAAVLCPQDFYRPAHQLVYEAVLGLRDDGAPVDAVTVEAELRRRRQLPHIGGAASLVTFMQSATFPASTAYHVSIVAADAARRRYIEGASQLEEAAYSPGTDLAMLGALAARLSEEGQRFLSARPAARYVPVDWEAAWKGQPEAVEWLIEPVIEAATVNALFALPGTGKSLLALEWALRLVRAGRTVVYLDDENRISDVVERLQAFGAEPAELARLLLYSFAGLPALDTAAGGADLTSLAVAADAALVVLDTTSRMVAGKENDSDTFLGLYRFAMRPLKARGIAVLRLDHPGKDAERGQRGSSAKDGDVDTIWLLKETARGRKYRLERRKSRSGHSLEDVIEVTREYAPVRHVWPVRTGAPQMTPLGRVCGQLSGLVPPSAGADRTRTALRKAGLPAANSLIAEVVKHRKEGCDCPPEWRTGGGQVGQPVTRPPSVRPSPARSKGDGGQVSGDQSPDSGELWPEGSYGEEAS